MSIYIALGIILIILTCIVFIISRDIKSFGNDSEGKRKALRKLLDLSGIIIGLAIVIVVRVENLINNDIFTTLLTVSLSALGLRAIPKD